MVTSGNICTPSQISAEVIKFVTNDFIPVKTIGAKTSVAGTGTNGGFGSG